VRINISQSYASCTIVASISPSTIFKIASGWGVGSGAKAFCDPIVLTSSAAFGHPVSSCHVAACPSRPAEFPLEAAPPAASQGLLRLGLSQEAGWRAGLDSRDRGDFPELAGCLQVLSPEVGLAAVHSRLAAVDLAACFQVVLCPAVPPAHLPLGVLTARSAVLLPAVLDRNAPIDLDVPQGRSPLAALVEHSAARLRVVLDRGVLVDPVAPSGHSRLAALADHSAARLQAVLDRSVLVGSDSRR
jgi:hypothetical protein